jgi:hypothetical protein
MSGRKHLLFLTQLVSFCTHGPQCCLVLQICTLNCTCAAVFSIKFAEKSGACSETMVFYLPSQLIEDSMYSSSIVTEFLKQELQAFLYDNLYNVYVLQYFRGDT